MLSQPHGTICITLHLQWSSSCNTTSQPRWSPTTKTKVDYEGLAECMSHHYCAVEHSSSFRLVVSQLSSKVQSKWFKSLYGYYEVLRARPTWSQLQLWAAALSRSSAYLLHCAAQTKLKDGKHTLRVCVFSVCLESVRVWLNDHNVAPCGRSGILSTSSHYFMLRCTLTLCRATPFAYVQTSPHKHNRNDRQRSVRAWPKVEVVFEIFLKHKMYT